MNRVQLRFFCVFALFARTESAFRTLGEGERGGGETRRSHSFSFFTWEFLLDDPRSPTVFFFWSKKLFFLQVLRQCYFPLARFFFFLVSEQDGGLQCRCNCCGGDVCVPGPMLPRQRNRGEFPWQVENGWTDLQASKAREGRGGEGHTNPGGVQG